MEGSTTDINEYDEKKDLLNNMSWNTGDNNNDNNYTYLDPYDYVDIASRVRIFLSTPHLIIMLTLGSIAILVNLLSLFALFQVRNRMNTHYRLIVSLSVADTLVGVSILLIIINKVFNPVFSPAGLGAPHHRLRARCMFMFVKGLNNMALNISLLNLVGMSIDHYMAINKPLNYPKLMNGKRIKVMVFILWIVALICGFSVFFAGLFNLKKVTEGYNYCEAAWMTSYEEEFITFAISIICLFVMLFIYVQIYKTVSQHRVPGEQLKNDERKNRRALITTLLILGSFMLCWLPSCVFQFVMIIKVTSGPTAIDNVLVRLVNADKYLYDLLLLNSICDPIIYTVRTYEVQLGYRRLFSCFGKSYLHKNSQHSTYTTTTLLEKKISNGNKVNDDLNNSTAESTPMSILKPNNHA